MTTTSNLSLNQPAYNSSAWDQPLNYNETILDNQLAGTTSIALTNLNVTLTSPTSTGTGQTQAMRIALTGSLSASVIVYIPAGISGKWIIYNTTSGTYTVTIASLGGGTSIIAPQGYNTSIYSDGTNVRFSDDGLLASGIVSSFSAGSTGLTPSTASTGAITLAGSLNVSNGGTGATTLAANNVLLGNGTGTLQTVAPGTSGNVLTSNGTTWASSASSGLGVNQNWVNVTGSRSAGTTYTNSTSSPIMVIVSGTAGISVTVNGVNIMSSSWGGNFFQNCSTFVVPAGQTYLVNITGSLSLWSELR